MEPGLVASNAENAFGEVDSTLLVGGRDLVGPLK